MRLKGKRAIVTGAAVGIGAAIARVFATEGAKLLVADKNLVGAEAVASSLREAGATAVALEVDVSRSESVSTMVSDAVRELGGLDTLVNNAAIIHRDDTDAEGTPEDVWDLTLAVNLRSVFLCSKFAIPAIEASGGGAIVNVASIVGLLGSYPSQIAYTASKGGVIALTRELAVVLARRGIRVNAICPGLTQTTMLAGIVANDAAFELRRLHIPMGRMGRPEEIAALAGFLASDEAAYITGQAIPIDGGMVGAYLTPPDNPSGRDD